MFSPRFYRCFFLMDWSVNGLICLSLAACSGPKPATEAVRKSEPVAETIPISTSTSTPQTLTGYKEEIAHRISETSSTKIFVERPQALLRSVIVLKFVVDTNGKLVRSEIARSNRDRASEATALASLRAAAPFPKPGAHLLRNGQIELSETWLFNNDGRFQLRSIALPQMDK